MGKTRVNERREIMVAVAVIALLVVGMLVEALLALTVIGERPRTWQYGSRGYIPAQSYSSTQPAPAVATPPKQVELPPPTIKRQKK